MRVELPDALSSVGVVDCDDGQLPVQEADDGTRYVETGTEQAGQRLKRVYSSRYDMDYSDDAAGTGGAPESTDVDEGDEDVCGYFDPETMESPCSRAAGWGRDADDGRCKTHAEMEGA